MEKKMNQDFLPLNREEMLERGWQYVDYVVVTGDAYVDHPSFGSAIISRLLEKEGYRVGIISQPDFSTSDSMKEFGRPRYGFFIGGGNVDSMVAHYSVAKIRRDKDEYTPGGVMGKRPDRSATVYTQLAKAAYPDLPVVLGGLEASLRRFAHYDYWMDQVLPSIMETSGADLVAFGMSAVSYTHLDGLHMRSTVFDGQSINFFKNNAALFYVFFQEKTQNTFSFMCNRWPDAIAATDTNDDLIQFGIIQKISLRAHFCHTCFLGFNQFAELFFVFVYGHHSKKNLSFSFWLFHG